MLRIRTSALNQVALCPASAYPAEIDIVPPSGEPARLGTGIHESMEAYIPDGKILSTEALAQAHDVDEHELDYLCYAGRRAWDAIKFRFTNPVCERELTWCDEDNQITLTGHPDVFSIDGDKLVVADWKSGFLWSRCEPQLRGYAWLIAQEFPVQTIEAVHVNIRTGEIDVYHWTIDELAAWWGRIAKRIDEGREAYAPSYESCRYCHRFHECPAGEDLTRQALTLISDSKSALLPEIAVDAYQRARFVEKVAKDIVEAARIVVAQAEGELVAADGTSLRLTRQPREQIDAGAAFLEATKLVSVKEFHEACNLGKTKLLAAVRDNAPRGQKKERADDLMDRLRAAGAVTETFIEKLELRKGVLAEPQMAMIEQTV